MCNLNSNDYKILTCVVDNENNRGLAIGRGSTLKQIIEKTGFSEVKVRNTIKVLIKEEFVVEGVKKVKAKTYCITIKGIEKLKELKTNII